MSIVNWNNAPIGTTHVFVPTSLSEPLECLSSWEKWANNKVYMWNDEILEWDLMSYDCNLVDGDKRVPNPNGGDTDINNLKNKLENINACNEAVEWIKSFSSYEEAWDKCDRGDWMLWIAYQAGIDLKTLTKAKVECAKLVEHLMTDERSIEALRTAERFADGVATRAELRESAAAAHAATYTAYTAHVAADAHDAAYASAHAAANAAADAAAHAAAYAAYAAYAVNADTAAYAASDSIYKETLNKCANICRQYLDFNDVGAFLESIND